MHSPSRLRPRPRPCTLPSGVFGQGPEISSNPCRRDGTWNLPIRSLTAQTSRTTAHVGLDALLFARSEEDLHLTLFLGVSDVSQGK